MSSAQAREITAKTADYTLTASDFYGVFTNRGAGGAVTFTLPDPSAALAGAWVETFNVADQTVTLRATSASKLTVFNNATATSIAWSTASNKIGSGCTATCDGTTWLIHLNPGTTSGAATAATVTIAEGGGVMARTETGTADFTSTIQDMYSFVVSTTDATVVNLRDASVSGTIRFVIKCPALDTRQITFAKPATTNLASGVKQVWFVDLVSGTTPQMSITGD